MKRMHGRIITHLLLWLTVGVFAAFIFWANWATLDQITRSPGQVITSSRNQVIQAPPSGGVLESLMVREGAAVKKGQLLMRFERQKVRANFEEAATKGAALKAALVRLDAEATGKSTLNFPRELDGYAQFRETQISLFNRRRQLLNEDIATLEKMRSLAQQELDMNMPLLKSGDVSRAEVLRLERQVADLAGQVASKRNKFQQDTQTDMTKAQEDLAGIVQVMAQRREELDYSEVRSPMDGVVRNVRLTTVGGVARPGDELMQIVPVEDTLVIEAKVKTADVGFLRLDLPTTVKLDAYDYAIYGTMHGHVSFISADTITEQVSGQEVPFYRVHVKIDRSDMRPRKGEKLDFQPGMTATVEIKTGEKSVWSYLTKPITKTLDEALRER
jgi:adhesin transport system membrane fusion protein